MDFSFFNSVGVWRYKLQSTLRTCIPENENLLAKLTIDQAIDQACTDFEKLNASFFTF